MLNQGTIVGALLLASCGWWASGTMAGEDAVPVRVFHFSGGEEISITVADATGTVLHQSPKVVVSSDGLVSAAPVMGYISILGKSLEDASKAIEAKYHDVTGLKQPRVAISLTAIPARKVYVQGEVIRPQTVELPSSYDLMLAAALAEAGGVTEDANMAKIKVLRHKPDGSVQMDLVDATGFAKEGVGFLGPVLQAGDIIIVPRSEVFSVVGEVKTPGIVTRKSSRVPSGIPVRLSHVIASAGGVRSNADRQAILLAHMDASGQRKTTKVDLNQIEKGDLSKDPELKDGDQVIVPASEGIMVIGAVMSPGIYYIPAGPPSLSRLLALAGGFQSYAKKNEVRVVQKGRTGAVTVDMKSVIEFGRTELDQQLEPGDMVFVSGTAQ